MSRKNNLIFYFNFIRDIPYKIPLNNQEPDHCCTGKHKVLYYILKNHKIKVRSRLCEFKWSSLNLPKKVEKFKKEDICSHAYLEFYNTKK